MVVHVGLTVTVGGTPATVESVPDYTFTTDEPKLGSLGVYLRTDENTSSALGSWSSSATNNPEALTVVAPAARERPETFLILQSMTSIAEATALRKL
ncbi:MAG: hypothetical protein V8T01_03775 [Oscillospiraceae bacterium]